MAMRGLDFMHQDLPANKKNDYLYNGKSEQSVDPDFSRESCKQTTGWIGMITGRGSMMRLWGGL
jgi:hypothetical protein